jgi:hypothetical protein
VRTLRALAHERRATIAFGLREPSPAMFNMFDDMLFIANGRVMYSGPREVVLPHFAALGFVPSGSQSVASFLHVRAHMSWLVHALSDLYKCSRQVRLVLFWRSTRCIIQTDTMALQRTA